VSGDFSVQLATRSPDLSAVVNRWSAAIQCLSVCRVVLQIPRAQHARLVAGIFARVSRGCYTRKLNKEKFFPYSFPSVGLGADPDVQAVSLQVTLSLPPGGRLPLLSTKACGYLRSFSPDSANRIHGSTHPIPFYYSFIDPKRMKG